MYSVIAPVVYVTERAVADARSTRRMERMMVHVRAGRVLRVTDAELDAAMKALPRGAHTRTGQVVPGSERIIVFNGFVWRSPDEEREMEARYPSLAANMLSGRGAWALRDRVALRGMGGVCQSAYELHCAFGCLHGCTYCHVGDVVNITLNLEEYLERLDDFLPRFPNRSSSSTTTRPTRSVSSPNTAHRTSWCASSPAGRAVICSSIPRATTSITCSTCPTREERS